MSRDAAPSSSDPDLFSRELQRVLLTGGPRSRAMRRLWRLARKAPGAELERILETKVNEFKRHRRETRLPTLWNTPQRLAEWLADNVALTPPKEVLMTLVYVVLVLVGFEFARDALDRRFAAPESAAAGSWGQHLQGRYSHLGSWRVDRADDLSADQVDSWMTTQFSEAIQTDTFSQALQDQVQTALADLQTVSADMESQLARQAEALLNSAAFQDQLQQALRQVVKETLAGASPGRIDSAAEASPVSDGLSDADSLPAIPPDSAEATSS